METYLHNCSFEDLTSTMPDKSVDLFLLDPPYLITKASWDKEFDHKKLCEEVNRLLKPDGLCLIFGCLQNFALYSELIKNFKYELIWNKIHSGSPLIAKHRPLSVHEYIFVFGKRKGYNYNYRWWGLNQRGEEVYEKDSKDLVIKNKTLSSRPFTESKTITNNGTFTATTLRQQKGYSLVGSQGNKYSRSIFSMTKQKGRLKIGLNPTSKPTQVYSHLLNLYAKESDVVCDLTFGSGNSYRAARDFKVKEYIGCEKDPIQFASLQTELTNDPTKPNQ